MMVVHAATTHLQLAAIFLHCLMMRIKKQCRKPTKTKEFHCRFFRVYQERDRRQIRFPAPLPRIPLGSCGLGITVLYCRDAAYVLLPKTEHFVHFVAGLPPP